MPRPVPCGLPGFRCLSSLSMDENTGKTGCWGTGSWYPLSLKYFSALLKKKKRHVDQLPRFCSLSQSSSLSGACQMVYIFHTFEYEAFHKPLVTAFPAQTLLGKAAWPEPGMSGFKSWPHCGSYPALDNNRDHPSHTLST